MLDRFNGYIFALLLFLSSLLGSIFILFPFVPLAFFAPRLWRYCADRFVGYWLTFPASLLIFIFGVKFRVTGDLIDRNKPALVIMNHRTRLDWMFFWNALYKMDPWLLTTEKIVLKAGLKFIPGAGNHKYNKLKQLGWAMGCNAFTFLNRNYEKDMDKLKAMLKYYKDSHINYQVLLFPEGTDRGTRAVQISHEFADKHGLSRYDYVLHPRITGFNFILNEMRKNNYINHIYDVTVGYPGRIISNEMEMIRKGLMPTAVHFDVKKYDLKDVVGDVDSRVKVDASKWLTDLWKTKEERLRKYYEDQEVGIQPKFAPSGDAYCWPIEYASLGYYAAFLIWLLTSIMWIYFIIYVYWVKFYVICAISFYYWADWKYGGVDQLFVKWFYGKS